MKKSKKSELVHVRKLNVLKCNAVIEYTHRNTRNTNHFHCIQFLLYDNYMWFTTLIISENLNGNSVVLSVLRHFDFSANYFHCIKGDIHTHTHTYFHICQPFIVYGKSIDRMRFFYVWKTITFSKAKIAIVRIK